MAYELAKAYVQIVPTTEGFKGNLEKSLGNGTDSAAKTAGSKVGSAFSAAFKTAISGISSAVSSAISQVTATADAMDEIDKMSQKLGVSAEFYQEWDAVLKHSGTSMNSMASTFKTLSKAVQNGTDTQAEAFAELGLSMDDLANLSTEEVFTTVVSKLQQMEAGTKRTALASSLLGKGATELGALLNTSAEDTQNMIATVNELGGVMSNEAVKSGAAFKDNLQDVQTALAGAKNEIAAELLPMVNEVLQWVIQHMPEIKAFISDVYSVLSSAINGAVEFFTNAYNTIEPYLPMIIENVSNFVAECVSYYTEHIEPLINSIVSLLNEVLIPGVVATIDFLQPLIDIFVEAIGDKIDSITSALTGITDFLTGVFTGNWEQAWDGLASYFGGVMDGLVDMFKIPLNFIISGINTFLEGLNCLSIPDWVPGVGGLGFDIPLIPMLAKGGTIQRAGQAIVGEDGAELITLPSGATVTPLNGNNNEFTAFNQKLDTLINLLQKNGDTVIPVYIGTTQIDEVVVSANNRVNMRSGGFA